MFKHFLPGIVVITLLGVPIPASAALKEYKFAFAGEVTAVEDAGNRFNGAFHVGDAVDGRYNYFDGNFTQASDINGFFTQYQYFFDLGGTNMFGIDPAPVSLELKIGDHTYTSGRSSTSAFDYLLQITNDADGSTPPNQAGDRYHLQSQLQMPDHFQDVGNAYFSTVFALYDASGTALSSTELPTSAPDISKFASRIGRITLVNKFDFSELLASVEYRIDAIVAVPEPASAALLACALACSAALSLRHPRHVS